MTAIATDMRRIAAITRRDLQTERTYHLRHVMRLMQFAVAGTIVFHVARLVDRPEALAGFDGTYFDFAMVGLAVMSIASLGIGVFNQNIMREQSLGTLEVLLITPTSVSVLLLGSFVFPLMLTLLDLLLYFGVGLGIIGAGLSLGGVLFAIPLLALTLASFCAFGIIGAAFVVLVKRGDPVTGPLTQLTSILSGALFPVSQFPGPVEILARCFPAYYGITGLREALLGHRGIAEVGPDLLVLAAFVAVLLPLSVHIFGRALAAARRAGTLGNY
jgi:ABC-2 type transport system permease protein